MKTTFTVNWQYGVATHSGWFRMINEDRALLRIGTTDKGEPYAVAVIADGMGGSGDGELASETVLEDVKHWLDQRLPDLLQSKNIWSALSTSVEQLFGDLNERLIGLGKQAGSRLGTTLTLVFLINEIYFVYHIGDCRVYKAKDGMRLRQLTRDQTWVAEQIRRGTLTRQEARNHPKRNVLLQSLGMQNEWRMVRRAGFYTQRNMFLLCSDGFYEHVPVFLIESLLREGDQMPPDLQQSCDKLIHIALDKRSNDNISVLLLRPAAASFTSWQRIWHRCKNFNILFPAEWW